MAKGKKKLRNAPSTKKNGMRMYINRGNDSKNMGDKIPRWDDIRILLTSFRSSIEQLRAAMVFMMEDERIAAVVQDDEIYFTMLLTVLFNDMDNYEAIIEKFNNEIGNRAGRVKDLDGQLLYRQLVSNVRDMYDEFTAITNLSEMSLAEITDLTTMGRFFEAEALKEKESLDAAMEQAEV